MAESKYRNVFLYIFLLLISSGGVYWYLSSALENKTGADGETNATVFGVAPADLHRLEYDSEDFHIRIEKRKLPAQSQNYFVSISYKKDVFGHKAGDSLDYQASYGSTLSYFGASFWPFRSIKIIGDASKLNLDQYGLATAAEFVAIQHQDIPEIRMRLGKKNRAGNEQYMIDPLGKVHLVNNSVFRVLGNSERYLAENSLTGLQVDDIAQINFAYDGHSVSIDNLHRDSGVPVCANDVVTRSPIHDVCGLWVAHLLDLMTTTQIDATHVERINAEPVYFTAILIKKETRNAESINIKREVNPDSSITYWGYSSLLSTYIRINNRSMENFWHLTNSLLAEYPRYLTKKNEEEKGRKKNPEKA